MSDQVAQASLALVQQRARELVSGTGSRVLVLRARPRWAGPDEITVDGSRVLIRTAVSQLAALDALSARPPDDYLVLLTDCTADDLGDSVLVRAERQRIENLDQWAAVPGLYGAQRVDPELTRLGTWVPAALLEHQPAEGWPAAPAGVVTADHALGNLLGRVLRLPLPVDLDLTVLLTALDRPHSRAAWHATAESLRTSLGLWAGDALGEPATKALAAAARREVSVIALGLVLDVLWPEGSGGGVEQDQSLARGRIESAIDGRPVTEAVARSLGAAARTLVLRMDTVQDPAMAGVLTQAEALLGDVGWHDGAQRSAVLPSGLTARLRALAALLDLPDLHTAAERLPRVEGALRDVVAHDLANPRDPQVAAARMAVRLVRWAAQTSAELPAELGTALRSYLDDAAWVDRAAGIVWNGSGDEVIAPAYRSLYHLVRRQRDVLDGNAAQLLAADTARDASPAGAVLIENLLTQTVAPLAATLRPLVIVLDGMSVPVATELADDVAAAGWNELVPADGRRRVPVLAALPTLTRYSRTALFTGHLRDGQQDAEKAAVRDRFGASLFHKDDLRSPAGELLPAAVRAAIDDPDQRLVAVVLNTIDDALARHDPGGTRWTIDTVQHLQALLNAAAVAGRGVVLTSDHGHVVERGSQVRMAVGAEARWRPADGPAPQNDEVLIRGRRSIPGDVVLPWREDLRYTSVRSGYHGGVSLAEITVPVLLFTRPGQAVPTGWVPAPPQAPTWWNEVQREPLDDGRRRRRQVRAGTVRIDLAVPDQEAEAPLHAGPAPRPRKPSVPVDKAQGVLGFDVPEAVPAPEGPGDPGVGVGALLARLTASEVYAAQRGRAGRRALSESEVATALTAVLSRGGRAHRDTFATALGIPASGVPTSLAALGRLLNVDGYPVVAMDPDGVTVVLDEDLLREQFELGG